MLKKNINTNQNDNHSERRGRQQSNSSQKKTRGLFFLFFNRYTIWGVLFILVSIVISMIDLYLLDTTIKAIRVLSIFMKIVSELIQAIGIAFAVGAVFDFSKNSEEFIRFVSGLLSKIVVSKDFLGMLTENEKEDALKLILKPTNSQLEQYSSINDYFSAKINEAKEMFATNFKSHVTITAIAKIKEGRVVVHGTMRYRIYKIQDKYEPITIIFDDDMGRIERRRIISPNGMDTIDLEDEDIKENQSVEEKGGLEYNQYKFEIPEKLLRHRYLTIESEFEELGENHWATFNWTSLTPYDGVVFTIICQDGLIIKKRTLFDKKDKYIFTDSQDGTRLDICSTDWLDAFTGFSILIASRETTKQTSDIQGPTNEDVLKSQPSDGNNKPI
ncbi:MAG: hypothetical protein IKP78_00370 [Ruminococcus sp.]|nr:hypothetical protein [Ruminococcus sp.]